MGDQDWITQKARKASLPDAPTTPSRSIGAAFQPSATKAVLCSYTVQLVETTGQHGTVKLLSDAANPPTTERSQADINNANAATHTASVELTYLCPPGHYVKLVSSGTGTPSITQQVETPQN
jgi:hypothetical protein